MVDESRQFPFPSLRRAVEYIEFGNPARQRSLNLFEPERGGKPSHEQFTGYHPADLYASVVAGFERVLADTRDSYAKAAAVMYWKGTWTTVEEHREGRTYTKEKVVIHAFYPKKIAIELGISKNKVYRMLDEFRDRLESEYIARGLIKPRELERYDA